MMTRLKPGTFTPFFSGYRPMFYNRVELQGGQVCQGDAAFARNTAQPRFLVDMVLGFSEDSGSGTRVGCCRVDPPSSGFQAGE